MFRENICQKISAVVLFCCDKFEKTTNKKVSGRQSYVHLTLDTVIESANKQLFYPLDQIFAPFTYLFISGFLGYSEQHLQKSFT